MPKLTKREYLILAGALLAVFLIFYLNSRQDFSNPVFSIKNEQGMQDDLSLNTNEYDSETSDEDKWIVVDICGEIANPGVVQLEAGSRVVDAVDLAGGLMDTADRRQVNLARVLNDGEQLYIPKIEEEGVYPRMGGSQSGKININTASEQELKSLNGIGDALAKRIIEYRETNGLFKDIKEITNVSGIGEKKFENIKEQISIY